MLRIVTDLQAIPPWLPSVSITNLIIHAAKIWKNTSRVVPLRRTPPILLVIQATETLNLALFVQCAQEWKALLVIIVDDVTYSYIFCDFFRQCCGNACTYESATVVSMGLPSLLSPQKNITMVVWCHRYNALPEFSWPIVINGLSSYNSSQRHIWYNCKMLTIWCLSISRGSIHVELKVFTQTESLCIMRR